MRLVKITHRRARRDDFGAIRTILEANGVSPPGTDRASLRRFRRIVADLGDDFYVAVSSDIVVGFVHITYSRGLTVATTARLEALFVAPKAQGRGAGACLMNVACRRAGRRGCLELTCLPRPPASGGQQFLIRYGWKSAGEGYRVDLSGLPSVASA